MAEADNNSWKHKDIICAFLIEQFPTFESLSSASTLRQSKEAELNELKSNAKTIQDEYPSQVSSFLESAKASQSNLVHLKTEKDKISESIKHLTSPGKSQSRDAQNPHDLIRYLKEKHELLGRLTSSHIYLRFLAFVEEISSQTVRLISKSPSDALFIYSKLCNIYTQLKADDVDLTTILIENGISAPQWSNGVNNEALKAVTPSLREHVFKSVKSSYAKLKADLERRMENELSAFKWPQKVNCSTAEYRSHRNQFQSSFENLLKLTLPQDTSDEVPPVKPLLPISVLLKAITLKFRFHFELPDKPTNRLDKPEWVFKHVINTIDEHSDFLTGEIQNFLDNLGFHLYDAKFEFIRGLELILSRKLRNDVPQLLDDPALFSHTVNETILFVKVLRDQYGYDSLTYSPTSESSSAGVTSVFTGDKEWFAAWLSMEIEAARTRLSEILARPDAWKLQYESMSDIDELKATNSSEALVTLFDTITGILLLQGCIQ